GTMTTHSLVDELAAISRANGNARIGQLAIVAHGHEGSVALSRDETWNDETLPLFASDWERLHGLLAAGAQLDLYSCGAAAGPAGRISVQALARWRGADILASDNAVGSGDDADFAWESSSAPVAAPRDPPDPSRLEQIAGLRLDDMYEPNNTTLQVDAAA